MINAPAAGVEWLRGIDDALQLTRESLALLGEDRRTHTVTPKHLEDALEALSDALDALRKGNEIPNLSELSLHADTVVDIARTLTAERNDSDSRELLAWTVALQGTVASHQRNLDVATIPSLKARLEELIKIEQTLFEAMEFGFLFDANRQLLSIGYRVDRKSVV